MCDAVTARNDGEQNEFLPKWVRRKQEVVLLRRERAAPQYMSKLDILLRVIIRQRSNLAPDWMLQPPDGLLLIGGNAAIQLQLASIDFLQMQ